MSSREQQINDWLGNAEFVGEYQPTTVRTYRLHLKYLGEFVDKKQTSIEGMPWSLFVDYLRWKGWSKNLSRQAQSAGRAFLKSQGISEHDLFKHPLIEPDPKDGRTLLAAEVDQLRSVYKSNSASSTMHLAALLLSFHGALRVHELCYLSEADLMWDEGQIRLRKSKGKKKLAYAPFSDESTRGAVSMWLTQFRPHIANGISGDSLFLGTGGVRLIDGEWKSMKGHPLTEGGWRAICRKWAIRAGVPHFSPHSLRRAFAFHYCIVLGLPVDTVAKAGRWENLETLARYLVASDMAVFNDLARRANGSNGHKH
jgi:integrase